MKSAFLSINLWKDFFVCLNLFIKLFLKFIFIYLLIYYLVMPGFHSFIHYIAFLFSVTLTVHSPTKSNKGKWRKCAKSDYVTEASLIWERNRCPGSDTRVACHGWTVHCGAGGPRFETQGGTPIFGPLPFRGDSLEMKKGAWEFKG